MLLVIDLFLFFRSKSKMPSRTDYPCMVSKYPPCRSLYNTQKLHCRYPHFISHWLIRFPPILFCHNTLKASTYAVAFVVPYLSKWRSLEMILASTCFRRCFDLHFMFAYAYICFCRVVHCVFNPVRFLFSRWKQPQIFARKTCPLFRFSEELISKIMTWYERVVNCYVEGIL